MLPSDRFQHSDPTLARPFRDGAVHTHPLPAAYGYQAGFEPSAAAEGELGEYWHMLWRAKGRFILISLLGLVAAFFFTWTQSPVYRARTLLEIENLNQEFLNIRNLSPTTSAGNFSNADGFVRSQILVLQSRPVLERAIAKMDIEQRLLARIQPARKLPWSKALGTAAAAPADDRERVLTVASEGLKLRAEPNTRVIEVSFESRDPKLAADVANSIPAGAIEVSLDKRSETSEQTTKWLNRQLQDLRAKLEESENALQTYAKASNLTFFSEKDNVAEDHLRQLQLALSKAHADRVTAQTKYERARKAPGEALPEVLDDPTLKEYEVQLTTLRRQLAELLSLYTRQHPKVTTVQAQLAAVEAALEKKRSNIISRVRNEYDSALRQEELLAADYATQSRQLTQQANKVTHYVNLKHEVDATRQLYDSMVQKVKEAGVAAALRASEIHVIESARPPLTPFRPNIFYNMAFGLFSGMMVAVAVIVMRARADRGVRGPGETSVYLQVPELGVIPASNGAGLRLPGGSSLMSLASGPPRRLELTMSEQRQSAMAESFRLILTSILLSDRNGTRPHVIAVSSANAGEGKTMVISNLGIALAQVKGPVLLIDGDLRRPRLHKVFEVNHDAGLAEALAGESSANVCRTKIQNLHLLPSGKRQDEGLFFSPNFTQLLRQFKREFDTILIDTPPLLQMADARLIARRVDAVIMVISQHTPRDAVLLARQWLAEDGSPLLGTILNNWDAKTSGYGYRNYGYYGQSDYRSEQSA